MYQKFPESDDVMAGNLGLPRTGQCKHLLGLPRALNKYLLAVWRTSPEAWDKPLFLGSRQQSSAHKVPSSFTKTIKEMLELSMNTASGF